jgi:tRNA nucleotidyltransferase (CCA-adding enzyme)
MGRVQVPSPDKLLEQIRALPAGGPLLRALGGAGGAYLVGGAVRDLLLGQRPADLDLMVDGNALELAERIGDELVWNDRFGTATVKVNGFSYDIARARTETYGRPGALPDVSPAGIDEDLRRRDFTVNTLAVGLGGAEAGRLIAVAGALDDLDARLLRVLHDASFTDDPTRLLRLARYASRLGFAVEPHTAELAAAALEAGALATVSGPRVGTELRLLAREPDPVAALRALRELGADRAIDRRFGLAEADEPTLRAALELLGDDGRPDRLALAVAARGLGADELEALLDRLGFEAADREAIVGAATGADRLAQGLQASERPSEIADAAGRAGPEAVALAGALGAAAPAREWLERLRHVELGIDGLDLLQAGVPEGPAVGRGLAAARAAKLDGIADSPEEQLAAALRVAQGTG